MENFKLFLGKILSAKYFKKIGAYLLLIGAFYAFKDFLGIFLGTFIFAYLFLSFWRFLRKKIHFIISKTWFSERIQCIMTKMFPLNGIIITLYIIFIGVIIFILSDLLPKLINELSELPKTMPFLSEQIQIVLSTLQEIKNFNSEIWGTISTVVSEKDYYVLYTIFEKLKSASILFLQIVLSLILSFVFIIDRTRLTNYLWQIRDSNFGFLYKEYKIILSKIVKSFWLIFKAQSMIAGANALLTITWLLVIWFIHWGGFPYILTLWLIVFILGFVPVLWVFLSSIPIIIVAYSMIGGFPVVIEVLLLVGIVHTIEAYYLNPKIISNFLELPVSMTFIILIISEHFFGIAGLLVGVSLFYFIIGLLRDVDKVFTKTHKKIKEKKN